MVRKQVWDEVIFAGLDLCSKSGPNMLGKSRLHLGDVELPLQPRTHKVLGALKETHLFRNPIMLPRNKTPIVLGLSAHAQTFGGGRRVKDLSTHWAMGHQVLN